MVFPLTTHAQGAHMPGIGIITNPHSRRNKRHPERMRRLGYILGQHDAFELTNSVEDITTVAKKFRDNDIDVLALNGGDGTNHVTLTRFKEVYGEEPLPKIALLRGGTMNTVASGVGVRGTPQRLLANLVEKYYTGQPFETTKRDLLEVRDEHGVNYGFIFGNGVISNFLELYYEDTPEPSPATAAVLLTRAVAQNIVGRGHIVRRLFTPFRARMEFADHAQWPDKEYVAVMAATVDQIGLGFRPFIRCEERPHHFHILGVHCSPFVVAKKLPAIRMGLPVGEDMMYSAMTSKVTFTSDRPITYTIDGDMHTSQQGFVELSTGPRLEIILK